MLERKVVKKRWYLHENTSGNKKAILFSDLGLGHIKAAIREDGSAVREGEEEKGRPVTKGRHS